MAAVSRRPLYQIQTRKIIDQKIYFFHQFKLQFTTISYPRICTFVDERNHDLNLGLTHLQVYKSLVNSLVFGVVQNRHLAPKWIKIDAKNKCKM